MTLGEKIKDCRLQAKLSQEKLAELVGVSRQAVTKWEAGQSAPSTENLFKLAEILGTNVDFLLKTEEDEAKQSIAEQIYYMFQMEAEKKAAEKRKRWKTNAAMAALAAMLYMIVYFVGRMFWCDLSECTIVGWLFLDRPSGEGSYLYAWLLHQHLFWYAMGIAVVTAAFGKYKFSLLGFVYFVVGMLAGIWLGPTEYGTGEYGWLFWGAVYLVSIPMGVILEKYGKQDISIKSRKGKILLGALIGVPMVMILLVFLGMPDWKMPV